ncbi:ribonuclease H-like domain-containing protein [Desulfopila inferna]|uniref:ribonuclease H-like domain-containing protein n=1 Tax=Desulfopila inferna TaxID=468528 RepID=UPI00196569CE|nr:ribonuclease H-like domain-containing protein [Desulfopila inferna]MBM9606180.1 ribonuclease H-like domain-containing protein [Desulfopila inferna]
MLENTFCHINGIGTKTEVQLWQAGIMNWQDWCDPVGIRLSKRSRMEIPAIFEHSLAALQQNDAHFFCNRLKAGDQWRIFSHFRNTTAYIDIETSGLHDSAEITTIALYDGRDVFHYVNGRNLHDFVEDVSRYDVLVSYNGKSFDVPFIERFFNIRLNQAHIDLRFVLARLGFKGGLKGCEKQLGINRGSLDGVDGAFAVSLWYRYERYNDEKALETLLAYNIEDTVNLERLLVEAWNRNLAETPFAEQLLSCPQAPPLPFQPDLDCVAAIRRQFY